MIHPAPIVNRANGIFELAAGGEHMTPPRPLTTTWRIATDRDGRFRHSPDGTPATILAVRDSDGRVSDCVAWRPETPERWWLRDGEAVVLGAQALAIAGYEGEGLSLRSTPERWLAADGGPCIRAPGRCQQECPTCSMVRGVCVLRWDVSMRTLFEDVKRIECDSPALAKRLTHGLRAWEPRVTVTRPGVRHAA